MKEGGGSKVLVDGYRARMIVEIEEIAHRCKELDERSDRLKGEVRKEMEDIGDRRLEVEVGDKDQVLVANSYDRISVQYDPAVLREMLPRAVFKRITTVILDSRQVEVAYQAGRIPKTLISAVVVDAKKVEAAYEAGLVSFQTLETASTNKVTECFVVRRVKRGGG